jgi:FtsZ-binding cell division protein ZapB
MTDQETIDHLKEELDKLLGIKNFYQKEMDELEVEVEGLEAINESLRGEITHFNNLIESLYSVLNLAGFSPPED